jgi:hypothetical protein
VAAVDVSGAHRAWTDGDDPLPALYLFQQPHLVVGMRATDLCVAATARAPEVNR